MSEEFPVQGSQQFGVRISNADPEPMLTTKQVARRLGVTVETVCAFVRAGLLQAALVGRAYRFEAEWVETFLANSGRPKPGRKRPRTADLGAPIKAESRCRVFSPSNPQGSASIPINSNDSTLTIE